MDYLAENALPIWVGGAVLLTLTLVVYAQTRTSKSLIAGLVVIVVTAALLLAEYLVETPREAVERTLYALADAVERNDMEAALEFIAPGTSNIRSDVETVMPLVTINKANVVGTPQTILHLSLDPPAASVTCRGFVHGVVKRTGMTGGDYAEVTLTFVRDGDRWLVDDYTSDRDWHQAIRGGRK